MWKFAGILIFAVLCVNAEEDQTTQKGPQKSVLVETALCYMSTKPWNCVKAQAGRMLDNLEKTVEEKRHELMGEADEEMKKSENSRGLSDEEKHDQPSEIISALDKGFSAMANLMTDEVDDLSGRESRALKNQKKDVVDDANDFNDDFSIYDALSKSQFEGNLSDDARGKKGKKGNRQEGGIGTGGGISGIYDDDSGLSGFGYGYGSKGKGKKKKGKKGLMKMFFLGAIIKSKVELLLKVLSFHLQIKFFAVALASLMINLARFWIDIKKHPQKVVYVEHAQHQHHYDEHDDWGSSWKRQTANQNDNQYQNDNFAHRLAYNAAPQYQQR